MSSPSNRVRARREALGISQLALAERTKLSRQSIGAIEAGRACPSVDVALRIAGVLDAQVEQLFGSAEEDASIEAELVGRTGSARVALAHLEGRWVAHPLDADGMRLSADGLVARSRAKRAIVTPVRPLAEARDNVVLMGCASGLGLLADRLGARNGSGRFVWVPCSSATALEALSSGLTHVAGVHRTDGQSEDANVLQARRAASREPLSLITLARWEAGLLTRPDDASRVRDVSSLADASLRLVVRERGAGAQDLLERSLAEAGLSREVARRSRLTAAGHLDVARAIAMGAADAGVATRDAALAFGLRFVPLAEERYDLVLPRSLVTDPRIERLLSVLVSQAARRELGALGYDVRSTGTHVADVRAA